MISMAYYSLDICCVGVSCCPSDDVVLQQSKSEVPVRSLKTVYTSDSLKLVRPPIWLSQGLLKKEAKTYGYDEVQNQ